MAEFLELKTLKDDRGSLTVIEEFPFEIKRMFYIYGVDNSIRGKHRHIETKQLLICIQGSCRVFSNDGLGQKEWFLLDCIHKALLLEPKDWHYMRDFTSNCILQVLASTKFREKDYIYEPYNKNDLP